MAIDEKKIQKQAKQILDKFAKSLEKVSEDSDFYVDRNEFERIEKTSLFSEENKALKSAEASKNADETVVCNGFKKQLLENEPNHDNDFIIAEKGSWK